MLSLPVLAVCRAVFSNANAVKIGRYKHEAFSTQQGNTPNAVIHVLVFHAKNAMNWLLLTSFDLCWPPEDLRFL